MISKHFAIKKAPSGISKKILLILSLLGILILIFIGNYTKEFYTGTVNSIKSSPTKTTIYLEEFSIPLIIFNSNILLQKGDKIKFNGKEDVYRGTEQIIVDKIDYIKE
jgi:hypothetical protein